MTTFYLFSQKPQKTIIYILLSFHRIKYFFIIVFNSFRFFGKAEDNFAKKDILKVNGILNGNGEGGVDTAHTVDVTLLNASIFQASESAPTDKSLLWIDPNNGLKYWGVGYWRLVPVGFQMKQYYTVTNLVGSIGSFESGTWNLTTDEKTYTNIATSHVKYGSYSLRMKGDTSVQERTYTLRNSSGQVKPTLTPNHKYYVRVETYQESKTGSCDIYWPIAEPSMFSGQNGAAGQWNICSAVVDRSTFSAGANSMRIDYNNVGTAGMMWFDGLMLVDLTDTFGAGNEPDKAWCDANIEFTETTTTTKEKWPVI